MRYAPFSGTALRTLSLVSDPDEDRAIVRDREHVNRALAQGGFPRVEMVSGQTTWLWPRRRPA